jgi:multicomponent Na+:H+ antiporter subunit G
LQQDWSWAGLLVSLKILLILVFLFVASPTSTHAITQAALIIGIEPWEKSKR